MKSKVLLVLIVCLFSSAIMAQEAASVNWLLNDVDSQKVSSVEGKVLGFDQIGSDGFIVRDYRNGPGPDQRWYPYDGGAIQWGNETGQVDTRWVQFAVAPISSYSFNAKEITIRIGAKGTDDIYANVRYSTDTSFTNSVLLNEVPMNLFKDNDSLYTFTLDETIADTDTFYLRVYPWYEGSPSTSKYLYLRDATISGETTGDIFPASAFWELSDPDNGGSGLTAVTAGQVSAADEFMPDHVVINHYSGPEESQRVKVAAWPANQTEQIDSVYVQFKVSPRTGLEFTAKSISLGIAAASINTMKANISYSLDSTFAESYPIEYFSGDSTNNYLNRDTLTDVNASIDLKVPAGGSFYLRVYPWVDNDPAERTGKYVCLKNVLIEGEIEGNFVPDPPTVETKEMSFVGIDFATTGGSVVTDGGAEVNMRGVVWNTTGSPTTADNKTEDGSGPGAFISQLSGLEIGTTYYLRAYAQNIAGVGYGEELTFTTLSEIIPPTVETEQASNVLVESAESGGTVLSWGGAEVTRRGVCWNTTGNPTIDDTHSENGSGLGDFESLVYPLEQTTTYYIKAYAQNSAGVGYGNVDTITTQEPAPDVKVIVAQDGSGDYTTVQAAFDAVPEFYTGEYLIYVMNGTYYEKLFLDRNKPNVVLEGESWENTILTYDDYAAVAGGTSMSYSTAIDADDFTAINITFQNTYENDGSIDGQQAVALRTNGDRQSYFNCRLLGFQDTYYTWGGRGTGRTYMKNCYIEGSVDFIFGRNIVVFDSCHINVNRNECTITAASTEEDSKFGYVFRDCIISADSIGFNGEEITSISLGRPWQGAPRTVYMNTYEPEVLESMGWTYWNVIPALYAEYECYGPGYSMFRASIATRLSAEEAAEYTLENIFSMESDPGFDYDWMPENRVITDVESLESLNNIPTVYELSQNYPNPFNPTTTIRYQIPNEGNVQLAVYNILGQNVITLVDAYQKAGKYEINLNASSLASGIYLYRLVSDTFVQTKKMLLLK